MLLIVSTGIYAQHTIRLSIKNSEEKEPLAGATATISSLNKTTVADSLGIATFADIAPGTYTITNVCTIVNVPITAYGPFIL